MRLGKKAENVGGHVLADAVDVEEPGPCFAVRVLRRFHFAPPRGQRPVVAGEQSCGRLADLRNAESIDKTLERNSPALVDRGHKVARTEPAPTFTLGNHLRVEAEDVARLADQPVLPKGSDVLFAEPLDVEAVARHKVPEPLDRLRGAYQSTGAAPRDLAGLAHRDAAADRALVRELV